MELRNFLEIPYDELEVLNLEAKQKSQTEDEKSLCDHYTKYLSEEKRIKAVTIGFSNLEGRLHMLDYDKKFLLDSYDNLTFDGSSVKGFTEVSESDLKLELDWSSFRWLPSDVFGPGKVFIFGLIKSPSGEVYPGDFRGQLKEYTEKLKNKDGITTNIAVECEGFIFQGLNAEQNFSSRDGFEMVSKGGYYHSLPKDELRIFIDKMAEAQRAMGFENEKDHPEVAPSQFELNYKYTDALIAADQIQLYKLVAKQIASNLGYTASFLPKPIAGINGNGMHTNMSLSKNGKNIFYDKDGSDGLSGLAWDFVNKILTNANDLCLILNSSVNSYRRLDPAYEAPNQIKVSAVDRTSMIRIPLAKEKSARIEVRTVAPDAHPYLTFYSLLKTGFEGKDLISEEDPKKRNRTKLLPSNIHDALRNFKSSDFISDIIGADNKSKFASLKQDSAYRCPRDLGTLVKTEEILFHHDVTNQYIWSKF